MSSADLNHVVGRYVIVREIGRGGMAVVYLARQSDLDRQVALKELSHFHAGSVDSAQRFLREARLAGSLNHPSIVTVHDYFEHDATPYIAMEYVPQGSLRPYMRRLTLSQIAGVLEGVLAGLAHGEAAGIVHRDLKPENIMVTADGRVKITDFGIARAMQRVTTQYMTATGMTVGTPMYMAPEQAMAGDLGPWSDLYSLGVMTYEMVVGRPPFHDSETPMVILMRHINEPIPPAIELRSDVDPALSAWIDSLLVKDPIHRVRHAVDAWESLEDICVRLLGPLWRRDARLRHDQVAAGAARPLTPAQFESQPSLPTPIPGEASPKSAPSMPEPAPPTPGQSPAMHDQFVTYTPGRPLAPPPVTPEPASDETSEPVTPGTAEPAEPVPVEPAAVAPTRAPVAEPQQVPGIRISDPSVRSAASREGVTPRAVSAVQPASEQSTSAGPEQSALPVDESTEAPVTDELATPMPEEGPEEPVVAEEAAAIGVASESAEASVAKQSPRPDRSSAARRPTPRRGRIVVAAGVIIAAAAAAVIVLGSGRMKPSLSADVPGCVRDFLANTAASETLILGLPNRYRRASTDKRPVGLLLGPGRPVGAVRIVYHLKPTEYVEIQGAIDASTCRRVAVHDLVRQTTSANVVPYDKLRIDLRPTPYFIRPGPENSDLMEVDFSTTDKF